MNENPRSCKRVREEYRTADSDCSGGSERHLTVLGDGQLSGTAGSLPTDVIPSGSPNISFDGGQVCLARVTLDVQRAGTVALAIDDPLW